MQELEKILEEIDGMIESYKENPRLEIVDICYGLNQAKRIIRKHMKTNETFEFDFSGVESFDCQCGRHYINTAINDGWISVERGLPEDDDFVLVTVTGIYNALTFSSAIQLASYCKDDGWFIEGYPDWENPNVSAWRPLPEPYHAERSRE